MDYKIKYFKYKQKYVNLKYSNNSIDKWNNNLSKSLESLKKEVGKNPDYIINKPNGLVVFNNPTKWILNHTLRDEYVSHCVPSQHYDYLYTTISIYVPPKKIPIVQSISGSVILDLLKNTASARCAGTGANYATLRTVVDVIIGEYTFEQVSDMYKNNLKNMNKDRDYNINLIKNYVLNNPVKELKHHPFAFPEGCK